MSRGDIYNHGMAELVKHGTRVERRFYGLMSVPGREPGAGGGRKYDPLLPSNSIFSPTFSITKR